MVMNIEIRVVNIMNDRAMPRMYDVALIARTSCL